MKKLIVAAAVLAASASMPAFSQTYTPEFLAGAFAQKDEERGSSATEVRRHQMLSMMQRASKQCHNNIEAGQEAENVGNMVIKVREMLDSASIPISHYELLDVLNSTLGDGQSNWDCAATLALYATVREKQPDMSHIGAYKVIQVMRDRGMIGSKQ